MPKLPTNPATSTSTVSFATDIVPLFRPMDIQCMRGRDVFLADYAYMSMNDGSGFPNAEQVLNYLRGKDAGGDDVSPRMPFGGPYWSDESISLFQAWIAGKCQP